MTEEKLKSLVDLAKIALAEIATGNKDGKLLTRDELREMAYNSLKAIQLSEKRDA